MSNKGWVKLHREQFGHWVSKNKEPFCDGYAWCYLYANANHKKGIVNFRNEYIEVERGQLLRSKLQLQENFKWTRRHVENFLLALKNDEMITYRMTNRYTVITILNYEKYQGKEDNDDIQNTSQVTNRKQTESKQIANDPLHTRIIKNVKNDNNEKNEIYNDVISYLNLSADRKYTVIPAHTKFISARIKEGEYTLEDFQKVIDTKVAQWKDKPEDKYLRPETLFGNKFEGYLNEKVKNTDWRKT